MVKFSWYYSISPQVRHLKVSWYAGASPNAYSCGSYGNVIPVSMVILHFNYVIKIGNAFVPTHLIVAIRALLEL